MYRPSIHEYPTYFNRYISLVPEGDVLVTLSHQAEKTIGLLANLSEEVSAYRYEPGKWSVKEVIGHVIDTERVFNYRALCFARGDQTKLPSFDQDKFAEAANYKDRSLLDIIDEFGILRRYTTSLFKTFNPDDMSKMGSASDYRLSLGSIAFIVAGHELHHVKIIKDRYLKIKD